MPFRLFGLSVLLSVLAMAVHAAVPAMSPEQLRKESTHVVVGKVTEVYTSAPVKQGDGSTTHIVAQIEVQKVEKGGGLEVGKVVYARYWASKYIGKGTPPIGSGDQYSDYPKVGDRVRVYLSHNGKNFVADTRKDGGYDVMFPNGFEDLKGK
jgi:hypothetical protein